MEIIPAATRLVEPIDAERATDRARRPNVDAATPVVI
jgi:hypothetical protein